MHDSLNPMASPANPRVRTRAESKRLAPGQAPGGDMPARDGGTASITYVSDVIGFLKAKRDRYKGRGKMLQARTVQACIDELLGVWK